MWIKKEHLRSWVLSQNRFLKLGNTLCQVFFMRCAAVGLKNIIHG